MSGSLIGTEFDSKFELEKLGQWLEFIFDGNVHITYEGNEHTSTRKTWAKLRILNTNTVGIPYTYLVSGSAGWQQATQHTAIFTVEVQIVENLSGNQIFGTKNPVILASQATNRMHSQPSHEKLSEFLPGFGLQTIGPVVSVPERGRGVSINRAVFTLDIRANQHFVLPYEVHPIEKVSGSIQTPPAPQGFFLFEKESFDETLLPIEWAEGSFEQGNLNQVVVTFDEPFSGTPIVYLQQDDQAPFDVPYTLLSVNSTGFVLDIGLEQMGVWNWQAAYIDNFDKGLLTTGSFGQGTVYNVLGVKEGASFTRFTGENLDQYDDKRLISWIGMGDFLVMPTESSYSAKTLAAFMSSNQFVSGGFFALRLN